MKLDKTCSLFFGTKIDSKLREALSQAKPGDRKYFDGSSEEFLRIIELPDEKWIGKVIKPGPVVTEVDDIQRNIVSIMRRVAPGARVSASGIRVFALPGAAVGASAVIDDEGDDDPAASGPYISM
ncbi:MAG: hypothetical protein HS111_19330 [Kofleriaceae bacterium]|nr:hypothetical protein [Kofleriaceae bacterium]MCL4226688.1 hypothetical protein [Myxococcales bacterium]